MATWPRPQGSNETACHRAQAWIVAVAELRPVASPVNVPELEAPLCSVSDTWLLRLCPKLMFRKHLNCSMLSPSNRPLSTFRCLPAYRQVACRDGQARDLAAE